MTLALSLLGCLVVSLEAPPVSAEDGLERALRRQRSHKAAPLVRAMESSWQGYRVLSPDREPFYTLAPPDVECGFDSTSCELSCRAKYHTAKPVSELRFHVGRISAQSIDTRYSGARRVGSWSTGRFRVFDDGPTFTKPSLVVSRAGSAPASTRVWFRSEFKPEPGCEDLACELTSKEDAAAVALLMFEDGQDRDDVAAALEQLKGVCGGA